MNSTFQWLRITGILLVFLSTACEKPARYTEPDTILEGSAQKGPFYRGSLVTIYELDVNARRTENRTSTVTIDDQGAFEAFISWSGWSEIEITGSFFNEYTGRPGNDPLTLSSIIALDSGNASSNVNLLTHMAAHRIKRLAADGHTLADAYATATREIKTLLGLELDHGEGLGALDVYNGDGAHTQDNANLLLFSGAVLAAGLDNASQEIIMEDLADDGMINGAGQSWFDSIRRKAEEDGLTDVLKHNLQQAGIENPPDAADLRGVPAWVVPPDAGDADSQAGEGQPEPSITSTPIPNPEPLPPVNTAPQANAGGHRQVNELTPVTLNGSDSFDADGTITAYRWIQTVGNQVALSDADSARATFMAPAVSEPAGLTFALTVTDNEGASAIDSVTITIGPVNTVPVANAGTDRQVGAKTTVALSSLASFDPDGRIEGYHWVQTVGDQVALVGAASALTTFTAPEVTDPAALTFALTVSDNEGATATDSVTIMVDPLNIAPVADAGADQGVDAGTMVILNGNGSLDPEGDIEFYRWEQTSGEPVALIGAASALTMFTAPGVAEPTVLTFELTVADNKGATATDSVTITANPVNIAPEANAGIDQAVDAETAVTLDGSGSLDAEGGIANHRWIQTTGDTVVLTGTDSARAEFVAPAVTELTTLVFELTVTDSDGVTGTDAIMVTVAPTANGQALLGPVVNAAVEIFPVDAIDAGPLYTTTTQDSGVPDKAGYLAVPEGLLEDGQLYLVRISGGNDIDADDDGVEDETPTPVLGAFHAVLTGADMKQDHWTINPLTEAAWQQLGFTSDTEYDANALLRQLDDAAAQMIMDDLTGDDAIDRADLYVFSPRVHRELLTGGAEGLQGLIDAIHADGDVHGASLLLVPAEETATEE